MIKEHAMGRVCSTDLKNEKSLINLGWKTWREEATWKTTP
jgi:hypothetical protein